MIVITKEEKIASVPERWRRLFGQGFGHWRLDQELQEIQKKLDSVLIPSKEEYDKITGNTSWTTLECDSCGKDVEKVVFVHSRASEEYGESAFCQKCLEKYLMAITNHSVGCK